MGRTREDGITAAIAILAVPTHLIGLLRPAIYRDPAILLPQNLGTDLVTLAGAVPLLLLAAFAMRRGSWRGRVLWLGVLGYLTYCYGMYAMGVHWNQLFLLYVALFGLSLAALIIGLVGTDVGRLHAAFVRRPPVRSVATYLLAVAVLVAALWLVEEVPATLHGVVPATVTQFATPTNIVHVFDLAIVLPAMVVAAVQLLRDRPWGYLLSGMLLVKATAIGLWILAMTWFTARTGYPTPAAPTVFFAALTVSGGVLAWRFLQALGRGTTRTSASKVFAH